MFICKNIFQFINFVVKMYKCKKLLLPLVVQNNCYGKNNQFR